MKFYKIFKQVIEIQEKENRKMKKKKTGIKQYTKTKMVYLSSNTSINFLK